MKTICQALGIVIVAALVAFAPSAGVAQAPGGAAEAPSYTLDEALAIVAAPDVYGFTERMGGILGEADPNLNAMSLQARLGSVVGDPTLQGLPEGAGVVVVVFSQNANVVFAEVDAGMMATYQNALTAMGQSFGESSGLLLVSRQSSLIPFAEKMAPRVKSQYLAGQGEPEIRATVFVKRLVDAFGPQAETMIQGFLMMTQAGQMRAAQQGGMSAEAMMTAGQVLAAEVWGFWSFAKQVERLEIVWTFAARGPRMDMTTTPLPGTDLAAFVAAPVDTKNTLNGFLSGDGAIRGTFCLNTDAYAKFAAKLTRDALERSPIDGLDTDKVVAYIEKYGNMYEDQFAFNMMFPGAALTDLEGIGKVEDVDKTLQYFENMKADMEAAGIAALQRKMGQEQKITFTKNVREYKGTPVHLYAVDMEWGAMPGQQAEMMEKMMGDMNYEIAFVDGKLVMASDPLRLEGLVDAVKAGSNPKSQSLAAEAGFGPKVGTLCDMDLGRLVALIAEAMPGDLPPDASRGMAAFAKSAAGLAPIQLGIYGDREKSSLALIVPSKTIQGLIKAGKSADEAADNMSSTNAGDPRRVCMENLARLEGAKEQWGLETNAARNATPKWSDLIGQTLYLKRKPVCPSGGTYTINSLDKDPTCGVEGHVLP